MNVADIILADDAGIEIQDGLLVHRQDVFPGLANQKNRGVEGALAMFAE